LNANETYNKEIESIKSILPEGASITGNDVISNELADHFAGSVENIF